MQRIYNHMAQRSAAVGEAGVNQHITPFLISQSDTNHINRDREWCGNYACNCITEDETLTSGSIFSLCGVISVIVAYSRAIKT